MRRLSAVPFRWWGAGLPVLALALSGVLRGLAEDAGNPPASPSETLPLAPEGPALSPRFLYQPSSPYSLLKPDQYLSPPHDEEWELVVEGTNLVFRRVERPVPPLREARPVLTPEMWRSFVRAESEAERIKRQREVEEAVRRRLDLTWEEAETELQIRGRQTLGVVFGDSFWIGRRPRRYQPSSTATRGAPELDQSIDISIVGRIGKKVTVNVDTSRKTLQRLQVDYDNRDRKDAFVQYITAGNIPVAVPGTALASGSSGGGGESFGVKMDARRNKANFQFAASMARGIPAEVTYKGTRQLKKDVFDVRNYVALRYFLMPEDYKPGTLRLFHDDGRGMAREYYIAGRDYVELRYGAEWAEYPGGIIEVKKTLGRTHNLLVAYEPVDGVLSPRTNAGYNVVYSNVYVPILLANRESPYEFRGVYRLSQGRLVDTSDPASFRISLYVASAEQPDYIYRPDQRDGAGALVEDKDRWDLYYLDEDRGLVAFRAREPFRDLYRQLTGNDPSRYLYTYTPEPTDRRLYLAVEYKAAITEYSLHPDIIEGSEVVRKDGRVLVRDRDYRIDYFAGTIEFLEPVNPESELNITYEYSPFGAFSQQFLLGGRADYKPWDWLTLTAFGVYNGRQRPIRVPSVSSAAEERFVAAVAGNADFNSRNLTALLTNAGVRLRRPLPFGFRLGGEVAGSFYNPNNFGVAMVDDFENRTVQSISLHEANWLLYTPVDTANNTSYHPSNRGRLYYRDYYYYDILGQSWHILERTHPRLTAPGQPPMAARLGVPYEVKPGPYRVGEGHVDLIHLDPYELSKQDSLVFEYDFSDAAPGQGWVSVINTIPFRQGLDFSLYSEVVLWVKLEPVDGSPTNRVGLRIGLGEFSEDIDDDGVFEAEPTANARGIRFTDPWRGDTWVGGGSFLVFNGVVQSNDGVRQTEDMNRNGRFDKTSGRTNLFLPDAVYARVVSGNAEGVSEGELVVPADGRWRQVRIAVSREAMTPDQLDRWRRGIRQIVLILEQKRGFQGRLFIDSIDFTGPAYSDLRINGQINTTNVFRHLQVSFQRKNDGGEYSRNTLRDYTRSAEFLRRYRGEKSYEYLHGRLSELEWNQTEEEVMEMTYAGLQNHDWDQPIEAQDRTMFLVGRFLGAPLDLRHYRALKFWTSVRESAGDEWLFVRFGSSAADYYEYRVPVAELRPYPWNLITIDIRSEEFISTTNRRYRGSERYRVEGNPNLRAISYLAYGVYGAGVTLTSNLGRLWFNDVYLDKAEVRPGYAYQWNAGASLDGHLSADWSHAFINRDYSGQGAAGSGLDRDTKSLAVAWSTVRWLPLSGSWSRSWTESARDDVTLPFSQRGRTESEVWSASGRLVLTAWEPALGPAAKFLPDFQGTYRLAVASNQTYRSRGDRFYSINTWNRSDSWTIGGTWRPPFPPSPVRFGGVSGGYAYTRSDSRAWVYHGTNSVTNYIVNPVTYSFGFNVGTELGWTLRLGGPFDLLQTGVGSWRIAPSYNQSESYAEQRLYRFFDQDPRPVPVSNASTYGRRLTARSRSLSTPLEVGRILGLTPSMSYAFSYDESGFFYRPASTSRSNPMVRNPSVRMSFSQRVGEITFRNFVLQSVSLTYSRNFSLSDAAVRDDWRGGWEYLGAVAGTFGTVTIPYPFRFIPVNIGRGLHEPNYPNMDFVSSWTDRRDVSVSLSESLSSVVSFGLTPSQRASVTYTFSQETARNRGLNYTFNQRHSLSHGSSIDLMRLFRGFLIWRESKDPRYRRTSTLGYNVNYTLQRDFITSRLSHTVTVGAPLTYGWTAENSINISSSYTYRIDNIFAPSNSFQDYVRTRLPNLYPRLAWSSAGIFPRAEGALNLSTSYSFPTDLPERWRVPLINRVVNLDTRINHTASLSFANRIYYYRPEDPGREPEDLLAQVAYRHSVRYDVTQNINGTVWLTLAYDVKGLKGEPAEGKGHVVVETDHIGSFETGLQLAIVF